MNRYFDIYYDNKSTYPKKLCRYLLNRFNIKDGALLLDVGCGIGDYVNGFTCLGIKSYGIDSRPVSDNRIKKCDLDKEAIPYKSNTFDVVFTKSFVEHLNDPYRAIMEMKRVLKPNGLLIVMTPDWKSGMKTYYDGYDHKSPFTQRGLKDLIRYTEFKEVECDLFYQLPFIWKYPSLVWIPKIISILPDKLMWKDYNTHRPLIRFSKLKMLLAWGYK